MFSVATNFDDELPRRLAGLPVTELFGACDDVPVGHGRPRAVTPPVSWRALDRHVRLCRALGIGFNLLLNALCLDGLEHSVHLERKLRRTLRRAKDTGISAVTVAHPWLVELAAEAGLRIRVSVFVGICTTEQARHWEQSGAHVLALDTHVVSRDFPTLRRIVQALDTAVAELPVNIGCLLRCPIARNHAARLSHSSKPGAQPVDPCVVWCRGEKKRDPYHVVRSDFIRPEDLERYEAAGIRHFKIVDRSCSTEALVERVEAYANRKWDGDLLELIGPKGNPPRRRRLPVLDALRHLGIRRSLANLRDAEKLIDPTIPWTLDNRALGDLLLPNGCTATRCDECGHCAEIAGRVARQRTA